jgi:hypothetical protein
MEDSQEQTVLKTCLKENHLDSSCVLLLYRGVGLNALEVT